MKMDSAFPANVILIPLLSIVAVVEYSGVTIVETTDIMTIIIRDDTNNTVNNER